MILDEPALLGVNVTEQLPEAKVQLDVGVNEPLEVPERVKLTVPVGVEGVPVAVSATVAVQVEPLLTTTAEGVQLTVVELVRPRTVRMKVPELKLCDESP